MKCPKCNAQIKEDKKKCPKCGTSITKDNSKRKTTKKKNSTNILLLIGLVAIVLIIVLGLIVKSNLKDEEKKIDNKEEEKTPVIEGSWKKQTFSLAGTTYQLMGDYDELAENGWVVKESKNLESKNKTYTDVAIEHEKYKDSKVKIGFINNTDADKKYEDCQYWGIEVSNDWSETPIDFSLPGGVEYGSTLKEVEEAYGKPEEENIYHSETLKYYEYIYEIDETLLTLTIYEDGGVTEFSYKAY